jgi:alcohol dehydrogenase
MSTPLPTTWGGLYGVPHGLANAVILPYVLELSREDAEEKLARLAIAGGIGKEGQSGKELSMRFIEKIKEMNRNMDIPTTIKELQEKDIALIAQRALKEANPTYPVPTILNQKECEALVRKLLP